MKAPQWFVSQRYKETSSGFGKPRLPDMLIDSESLSLVHRVALGNSRYKPHAMYQYFQLCSSYSSDIFGALACVEQVAVSDVKQLNGLSRVP